MTTPAVSTTKGPPSPLRGWIVTWAAFGINLASGTLYAWSIMAKALRAGDPNRPGSWSALQANLPFAVATAAFAIMMIFAGWAQDKLGPRRVGILGGFVLGGGFIAAAFAMPSPAFVAASFAIVGIGIGLAYSATTPAAIKWFSPTKKGMITGIVVAGVGLAPTYAAPLAHYLLNVVQLSVSNTFQLLGAGTILAIGLLGLVVSNPPLGYVVPAVAATSAKPRNVSRPDRGFAAMLSTPQFYLLWFMFVLAAAPGLMVISNVASIAKDMKWDAGFVPIIVLAAFNASGRIVGGFVSDRIGRTNTMLLFFVLQAINIFAFTHYTTPALLIFGAGFTGLCYGTIFTLMPAATADFYGLKNMGVNYGFVFTAFGVAGCTGSLLAGSIRDLFGSYDKAYFVLAIMLLVAAVLAFLTHAPKIAAASADRPDPAVH